MRLPALPQVHEKGDCCGGSGLTPEGLINTIYYGRTAPERRTIILESTAPSHQRCTSGRIEHALPPRLQAMLRQQIFRRPVGADLREDRAATGQADAGDA